MYLSWGVSEDAADNGAPPFAILEIGAPGWAVQRILLAPAPRVSAEPIDPQANSAVDSFVAYLKTETNAAMPRRLKQGRGSAEPSLERGCRLVLGQDRAISTRRARRDRCLAVHSIAAGR